MDRVVSTAFVFETESSRSVRVVRKCKNGRIFSIFFKIFKYIFRIIFIGDGRHRSFSCFLSSMKSQRAFYFISGASWTKHPEIMYFVGVDVGTGSVRAALVDNAGRILKKSTNPIRTWNPEPDFYQQSSDDIWRSCCKVVRVRNEKFTATKSVPCFPGCVCGGGGIAISMVVTRAIPIRIRFLSVRSFIRSNPDPAPD